MISFNMEKAGLYIHYPFCRKICPYCHFIKTVKREELEDIYLKNIIRELELLKYFNLTFDTLYFGGGTPSLLKENIYPIMDRVFEFLKTDFKEISIEINPEDIDEEFVRILKDNGITRVSVGIQQLSERILKILGRAHTLDDIKRGIEILRDNDFVLNYDFIIGVPEEGEKDIDKILNFLDKNLPDSVSVYLLEGVKGKYWNSFKSLSDEEKVKHFNRLENYLEEKDIKRYEISNFARAGKESIHNLKYWNYENFIGVGPSAASLLNSERWENKASLYSWAEIIEKGKLPFKEKIKLSSEERAKEAIMMGLRKIEGIKRNEFKRKYGKFPEEFIPFFEERKEFFEAEDYLRVKRENLLIFNSILSGLFN